MACTGGIPPHDPVTISALLSPHSSSLAYDSTGKFSLSPQTPFPWKRFHLDLNQRSEIINLRECIYKGLGLDPVLHGLCKDVNVTTMLGVPYPVHP